MINIWKLFWQLLVSKIQKLQLKNVVVNVRVMYRYMRGWWPCAHLYLCVCTWDYQMSHLLSDVGLKRSIFSRPRTQYPQSLLVIDKSFLPQQVLTLSVSTCLYFNVWWGETLCSCTMGETLESLAHQANLMNRIKQIICKPAKCLKHHVQAICTRKNKVITSYKQPGHCSEQLSDIRATLFETMTWWWVFMQFSVLIFKLCTNVILLPFFDLLLRAVVWNAHFK